MRPEAVDELARHGRQAALRGMQRGELEVDARLEGPGDDAARGVLHGREGLAQGDAGAGAGERAGDLRQGVSMRRTRVMPCSANTRSMRKRDSVEGPSEMKFSPSKSRAAASSCAPADAAPAARRRRAPPAWLALHRGMLHRGLGEAQVALPLGHRASTACDTRPDSTMSSLGRPARKRPTKRGRKPLASAGKAAMRRKPARRVRSSVAICAMRSRPTKARSTSA